MRLTTQAHLEAELKRLQEQEDSRLERVKAEYAAFTYAVSHDLKEPLRKIQIFGERLERNSGGSLDENGMEYLNRMRSASKRMGDMLDGLLEVSRVTTHGEPLTEVELGPVIELALADVESLRAAKNGQVSVGQLPRVEGDARQLRQFFRQLLANSFQYNRPGVPPVIAIRSVDHPNDVDIEVSDNGTGFAAEDTQHIFEVFGRLDTGEEAGEGRGIGLTICRKIAERHGGMLTAAGKPGEGAVFVLTLPRLGTMRG